jgi:brefeldin A-inhibited guanine nucleotide-exchange protein
MDAARAGGEEGDSKEGGEGGGNPNGGEGGEEGEGDVKEGEGDTSNDVSIDAAVAAVAVAAAAEQQPVAFPSPLHKDAFLLFRALCKLSVKESANDTVNDLSLPPDPVALQSKLLSLELLHSVLSHSGPSFRTSDKFVYAVKT